MPVFDEETFGPVAAAAIASDPDHAVDLARRITSGAAFINAIVASDP